MSQSTLPTRSTDPDTSHAAAKKAAHKAPIIRDVVLEIVQEQGPMTHDELIGAYNMRVVMDPDTPRASESGIRTRLSELKRARLVIQDAEDGLSNFGNVAKRWVAVDPDDQSMRYDPDAMSSYFEEDDIVGFGDDAPSTGSTGAVDEHDKSED